jgi:hypothetical protein
VPFDSPDLNLGDLLKSIRLGKIQLPDFQREWKWESDRIAGLLESISLGYPVGVVMTLEVGGEGVRFAPKPISGVDPSLVGPPEQLLLDGQQRLTSLFQALSSTNPVDTTDARGKRMKRWFYIDMNLALDPEADRLEAILAVPEDRMVREDFGRSVIADYSTTAKECAADVFPLAQAFDPGAIFQWLTAYLAHDSTDATTRLARWTAFYTSVLNNFVSYTVPVIVLKKDTPKEAVCTVFEKVNTGGVPLNVFELLTATFASDDFRLNDDWKARKVRLDKHPQLRSLQSTDFLQSISLLTTRARRKAFLKQGGDLNQAPGVSCKRKDILKLTLADYQLWADSVTEALEWSAMFLVQEKIFRSDDIPYRTQLVPLAAIKVAVGSSADTYGASALLRKWYWCGVLGELYGGATESRFARDAEQVTEWLADGPEPTTVTEASFSAPRLLTLRTRNSAAYKGIYALLMRSGCQDWVKQQPLDFASFFDLAMDIHHIFPKAWCEKNDIEGGHRESIINKTAISFSTNRSIGGRSPAEYVPTLEKQAGVSAKEMDSIIRTHRIDPSDLRAADFDAFFAARRWELLTLIEEAMQKPVIGRDQDEEIEAEGYIEEPDEAEEEIPQELVWDSAPRS